MGNKVREALGMSKTPNKRLTLVINGKTAATAAPEKSASPQALAAVVGQDKPRVTIKPQTSRKYLEAGKAAAGHAAPAQPGMDANAHGDESDWAYEAESDPAAWGKRQSPSTLKRARHWSIRPSQCSSTTRPAMPR